MNIRIKFQKYGVMKFIGHLDMMRYFQKAIRRADIDITYTEGYSPHQVMSFAAPLGVGVTSDGEYFDIQVNTTRSSEASICALNRVMAEGISILEYKKLPDTAKTAMSLVAAADYLVYVKPGYPPFAENLEEFQTMVQEFYQYQPEIRMTKHTKKQEIEMDLKPLIYHMTPLNLMDEAALNFYQIKNPQIQAICRRKPSGGQEIGLFLKVCTGSKDNVKPELVLEAFCRFHGIAYEAFGCQIHRLEVYAKADEIPVKGEAERKAYQNKLIERKKSFKQKGKPYPEFLALGEFAKEI